MITHIVLYKLKENTEQNRARLKETFLSMEGKIPSLKSIEVGEDFLGSERSFDIALICTYESREGMEEYQKHPEHQPVKQYVRSVTERSQSVDFIKSL